MEDRLLKIDQCLRIIPMAKSTWYDHVKDGTLPAPVKIGAAAFWRHSDLMEFIGGLAKPQPSPTAPH
jgi:prophage regulatory protein